MKKVYFSIIILVLLSLDIYAGVGLMEQANEKPRLVYSIVELAIDDNEGYEIWVQKMENSKTSVDNNCNTITQYKK